MHRSGDPTGYPLSCDNGFHCQLLNHFLVSEAPPWCQKVILYPRWRPWLGGTQSRRLACGSNAQIQSSLRYRFAAGIGYAVPPALYWMSTARPFKPHQSSSNSAPASVTEGAVTSLFPYLVLCNEQHSSSNKYIYSLLFDDQIEKKNRNSNNTLWL